MFSVANHTSEAKPMSNIPVDLPDHLMQFVDQGVKNGGFANPSEYIVALVAAANEKQGEIEQALLAGISSGPAEPWTDEEWQSIKERVVAKSVK
jgi:putative addiction module CopG family antidote